MSVQFQSQLAKLQEKQKTARVNNEHFNSVTILKEIITLCYKTEQWAKLFQQIIYLIGRRGQSKKAQIQMIQLAMTWLPNTPEPHRTTLIETIRDVCAKKIFLEVEYARCVMLIVKGKEDGDLMEAANILQEVQVETYGSMDKREKLDFILYQMKIMLKKEDYVRFFIISKKINENNINQQDIADLKVTYYAYLARHYNNAHDFPNATRAYRILRSTLNTTKKILPETLDFHFSINSCDIISNYVAFLALQSYSTKNHEQLQELSKNPQVQKFPHISFIISQFLSEQIVSCNLDDYNTNCFELFRDGFPHSGKHLAELKRMLVQHNLRIISKYYGRLTMRRVSELLNVEIGYCEEELCTLNNSKTISCRIDRIDGVIDFRPVQNEQYILKNWNESINEILNLVDITSNLIHREREVNKK